MPVNQSRTKRVIWAFTSFSGSNRKQRAIGVMFLLPHVLLKVSEFTELVFIHGECLNVFRDDLAFGSFCGVTAK